mmetsp:Transcript_43256/g.88514  ORF Transcript_43256/g.88514 Transcript_43256/m.88514 type:complete len:223 (+) Transcript_43256:682-1350(+)
MQPLSKSVYPLAEERATGLGRRISWSASIDSMISRRYDVATGHRQAFHKGSRVQPLRSSPNPPLVQVSETLTRLPALVVRITAGTVGYHHGSLGTLTGELYGTPKNEPSENSSARGRIAPPSPPKNVPSSSRIRECFGPSQSISMQSAWLIQLGFGGFRKTLEPSSTSTSWMSRSVTGGQPSAAPAPPGNPDMATSLIPFRDPVVHMAPKRAKVVREMSVCP